VMLPASDDLLLHLVPEPRLFNTNLTRSVTREVSEFVTVNQLPEKRCHYPLFF
jgi:hypothetical protein